MPKALRRAIALTATLTVGVCTAASLRSHATVSAASAKLDVFAIHTIREKLAHKLDELRNADGFPGGTAAVALPDGTVVAVSSGLSDKEAGTPMKPTDRMLAGSIGKTFFSAIVMNLLYKHELELDGKIEKWIGDEPWFDRIPNAKQITIRMLMNHTSGIPEHAEAPDFVAALQMNPDKTWTPIELLAFTFDKPPKFPAGTGWSYADTNFILLCYIAEKVTAQPLYGLIEHDILNPLKLNDTFPSTSRVLPGLIPGYSMPGSPFGFEGRTIHDGQFVINPQFEWAGGGFVSTSPNLASWAQDLYQCKAFPPSMLPIMLQSVAAETGPGDRYGLGVQVRQTEFGETYGHGGWFPGYLSEMEYFPEYRTAFAVQINTDGVAHAAGKTHSYIVALAKQILGTSVAKKGAVQR